MLKMLILHCGCSYKNQSHPPQDGYQEPHTWPQTSAVHANKIRQTAESNNTPNLLGYLKEKICLLWNPKPNISYHSFPSSQRWWSPP